MASRNVTFGVYPMPTNAQRPTFAQMEAAQRAYSRNLNTNQNARLARSNAAFAKTLKAWTSGAQKTQFQASAGSAQVPDNGDPTHGWFAPLFQIGLIFAAVLLVRSAAARRSARRHVAPVPVLPPTSYTAASSLLTPTEARFHAVLTEAVGPMATIHCKVRLADLLISRPGDLGALRRVSQKHVDFVLCDKTTLRPLVAVELDDGSHDRADRQERDRFVDGAYAQAGLPLLHVPVQGEYHTAQLLAQLQPHLLRRFSPTV